MDCGLQPQQAVVSFLGRWADLPKATAGLWRNHAAEMGRM